MVQEKNKIFRMGKLKCIKDLETDWRQLMKFITCIADLIKVFYNFKMRKFKSLTLLLDGFY